jgi:hypothetical protein
MGEHRNQRGGEERDRYGNEDKEAIRQPVSRNEMVSGLLTFVHVGLYLSE